MASQQPYVQTGEPLNDFLRSFWQRQIDAAEQETPDYRHPPLPLARIKKVMKSDPDVKMIAADAPILFCKACEIFIAEITARAFIIADSNKRRTLSRADIAKALTKSDQFDFLIDIVPREEPFAGASAAGAGASGSGGPKRQMPPTARREPQLSSPTDLEGAKSGEEDEVVPQRSEVLDQLESLLAAGPAPTARGMPS
ncbi:histone-fold-containing protein [Roridomyces roridus]|uniref:Histone-fold-containing protein n=1 Tax=Roridomyces roridus TaxID=1738132 RepID=A0AAD7FGE7_9AGAR|nr:histone-fold-containing protein [Roridomyces roridus]